VRGAAHQEHGPTSSRSCYAPYRAGSLLRDVARVEFGPDERRGVAELDGEGDVVSGIVLQRFGQNALDVIANVKAKIKEIAAGLPRAWASSRSTTAPT